MKKIVVTGGSGRLGQFVIREWLAHGYEVLSLDRVPPREKLCATWIADLRNAGDLFAADLGVKKVVIASSTAAFGFIYAKTLWVPDYLPLDESHPSKPQDSYGLSKVVGEQIADSIVTAHEVMTISSLRFPGVNFDLSYASFRDRWLNPQTRASGVWSYIDARDAAIACRLALEVKFRGHEVFIASAPNNCMIQPTLELIRNYLPQGAKIKQVSGTHWSCVDSAKAQRILGFKPSHVWQTYLKLEPYAAS